MKTLLLATTMLAMVSVPAMATSFDERFSVTGLAGTMQAAADAKKSAPPAVSESETPAPSSACLAVAKSAASVLNNLQARLAEAKAHHNQVLVMGIIEQMGGYIDMFDKSQAQVCRSREQYMEAARSFSKD